MKSRRDTPQGNITPAIEAINNLTARELSECFDGGQHAALNAHSEIELAPTIRKSGIFYRHLAPSRNNLVSALANAYRRYFKLALAHPREVGNRPNDWVTQAIQPAIIAALEWLRDWYILACDGENQSVRHEGRIEFVPGETVSLAIPTAVSPFPPSESWRAPAWLFQVSPTLGILLLRSEHVPANDSEEKLGAAHTRLLLRAARRSFLWQLDAAIETVRNEEIAAAGAIPAQILTAEPAAPSKPKHWLKGFKGLYQKKIDLSMYMDNLTDKQQMAFSLKSEYGLGLSEIAARMGLDRKTAYEHIDAAQKRIDQAHSGLKRRSKNTPNL